MSAKRTFDIYTLMHAAKAKGVFDAAAARAATRPEFASHRRPDAAARKWLDTVLIGIAREAAIDTPFSAPLPGEYYDKTLDDEQLALLAQLVNDCAAEARIFGGWVRLGARVRADALCLEWRAV